MTKFKALVAACVVAMTSGCQAASLPTAVPGAIQGATPKAAPQEEVNVRHVMDDGTNRAPASIWGINFIRDVMEQTVWYEYWCCTPVNGYSYTIPHYGQVHKLEYTVTGLGAFDYVGNGRILYKVPPKQMLVINEIAGGNVSINGLTVGSGLATSNVPVRMVDNPWYGAQPQYATSTTNRVSVNYVFGPGDDVVFTANPGTTIVGYTGDPAFLAGKGGGEEEKK